MSERLEALSREAGEAQAAQHIALADTLEYEAKQGEAGGWGLFGEDRDEAESEELEARRDGFLGVVDGERQQAERFLSASAGYESTDEEQAHELGSAFEG